MRCRLPRQGASPAGWQLFGLALGTVMALGAVGVQAQTAETGNYREKLVKQRTQQESLKNKAEKLSSGVKDLNAERLRLNRQLLDTAERIQDGETRMTAIESRLGELTVQEQLLRGSLNQQHAQIATLLGSLQRMGRNPPPVMMTHREDALAMVRSAMLLAMAFPGLRDKAIALSARLNELVRVKTEIETEGQRLRSETARLNDARVRLSGLMSEKKQSITQRQAELKTVQRAAQEISRSVRDLTELITKLDETVTMNTGLAAHNAKVREEALRPTQPSVAEVPPVSEQPPRIPPAAAPDVIEELRPRKDDGTQVAVLAPPSSTAITGASASRMAPAIPFHRAKGQLPLPARGKTLLAYGGKTEYGAKSKGVVIETRALAQITSPCDGWVVYAGEFRSYGQLLIINAGGGYHILLVGLSHIDVQPGQFVLAAEPVGTMGDGPSRGPAAGTGNGPVLYIEFRKAGRPIDPDPWWVPGPQKVKS